MTSPNPLAPPSPRRWLVFGLCAGMFLLSQFYRVSSAIIAPQLSADLGLDSQELGLFGASFFYAFAAAQLPMALVLDRLGARMLMAGLSLVAAAASWVLAGAGDAHAAVIGRLLLGLGMAANLMGPMKLFTRWFSPREFATLNGLMFAIGTLGNMLAATPLALMVDALGWRWSFRVIGVITGLLAVAFWLLVREAPEESAAQKAAAPPAMPVWEMVKRLFTSRDYWLISWATFCRYGTFAAIQGLWAGPFLMQGLGFDAVEAGNILLALGVGLILGSPLGGVLSDRVLGTRKWMVVLGLIGLVTGEVALALHWGGSNPWILGGFFFLMGVSSSWGVIMYAHIKETMPPAMSGMAVTGINFFTMAGAGAFSHLLGAVLAGSPGQMAGPESFTYPFLLIAVFSATALVLYLPTRDARPSAG